MVFQRVFICIFSAYLSPSRCVCVCVQHEKGCASLHPFFSASPKAIWQSSTVALHKNQHHLWPMASAQPLRSNASCWLGVLGGSHRALFVMLISWPNLNDPDICWPACVKPHIQFVPQIQKVDKTLEAVKNACVCVCVCSCCWCRMGERQKSFYSNACTRAIITSRDENQSVCLRACVLCYTSVRLCVSVLYPPTPNKDTQLVANTYTHTRVCMCSRAKEQWWWWWGEFV